MTDVFYLLFPVWTYVCWCIGITLGAKHLHVPEYKSMHWNDYWWKPPRWDFLEEMK